MSKVFIDTNILVYSLDHKDMVKMDRAKESLRRLVATHQPVISTQVLKEFYVVTTSKLKADPMFIKNLIRYFRNFEIVNNDADLIEEAIDNCLLTQLSFWDSLIVVAAEKAKCEFIYSEDFNPRQTYRGIKIVNFLKDDSF